MSNKLTALLGVTYPILQGAMAWISRAPLAAAVSNAGGLGILSGVTDSLETLRKEIRQTRAMTARPFGVNLMLQSPLAKSAAQLVVEERVPVVTTGAGSPAEYMEQWLTANIKVVPVVASVSLARWMEREGACAVIAEGTEAGGHVGDISTMCLVPQVCDAVSVPVVAAGGIADGRGMAAALLLGAQGVQIGTRFLAAAECGVHPSYTNRVLRANDTGTVVTGRLAGQAVRSLKSPLTGRLTRQESSGQTVYPTGALRRAVDDGDENEGWFLAGQSAGLVHRRMPAAKIVREIINQAQKELEHGAHRLMNRRKRGECKCAGSLSRD